MARPEDLPPESVILGQFAGLKNTVSSDRLKPEELERAINVDIDDVGQIRRRRGYTLKVAGDCHSLKTIGGKTLMVKDGSLVRVLSDFSVKTLVDVQSAKVCYVSVNGHIYFSSRTQSGIIKELDAISAWGHTNGQGQWVSPVLTPTDTLGAIGGTQLSDPPAATCLEAYKGRIYLADGKTLWATELYNYGYVDKNRNFMQFEHDIVMLAAVDDGIYVGTTGGVYFIKGVLGQFQLSQINADAVLPGSDQIVPAELVHPQARHQPIPAGTAVVFLTANGVTAGFDGGTCYNLTQGVFNFPHGVSAASLFRQDSGANSYVAAVDSGGSPAANARVGDYVDAEIVRFGGA